MNAEVELRQSESTECGQAVEKEIKPPQAGAKEAKDYLEVHSILQFVQGLLQAVIKDRPDRPYEYMARHLMSGYRDDQPRTPNSSKKPDVEATKASFQETGESQEAVKAALPPAVLEAAAVESAEVEVLSPAGAAPAAAPVPPEAEGDTDKALAEQTLAEAASLERVEEEAKPHVPPAASESQPAEVPQIAGNIPARRGLGVLRAFAQETLLEASTNGSLAAA
eukprot:CAMPEP_0172914570 /NCGR_PEP_ID=MMETSP1075-20121228/192669_1 /TAXON_ID=2916 /ORGANISM="Ceratium fusus, Strain PA161109" /LENGTH=222 /DNA_ID=CAMNT_0013773511 /DNA_START=191 /DNA_END=856 /DNA_ORIENTATION=+